MSDAEVLTIGAPMLPDPARLGALMEQAIASGWLANGGMLHNRLEHALADMVGSRSLALVSSGTMALMMALRLGNLPEGAEVITPALSFAATAQAIAWCGFRPVFADVDPQTLNLCPRAVRAAITPRTAAILPVHFLGVPCDVEGLAAVAREYGLWLAYDAAHAFGVTLNGRWLSDHGDASAFSLHATKVLHTGEGGFVVARDAAAAERLRRMRNFGLRAGVMTEPGINGKLSEPQAAMGLALLPDLIGEMSARQGLRAIYDDLLADLPGVTLHSAGAGASAGLTVYALRMQPDLRRRVMFDLAEHRILARDHFPILCGPGTCWPDSRIVTADATPAAPRVGPQVMCLPFHGRITAQNGARIAAVVRRSVLQGQQ